MRAFSDLTERDLLALAISSEEGDGRVYADFSCDLQEYFPDSAEMFSDKVMLSGALALDTGST
jgi:hypothetical protein